MRLTKLVFAFLAVTALLVLFPQARQVTAQVVPNGPIPVNPCSMTSYDDVAANALGMSAKDLRVALVSGNSLQDVAISKNVPLETVVAAIQAAYRSDYDQGLKDGVYSPIQQTTSPLPVQPVQPGIAPTFVPPSLPIQPVPSGASAVFPTFPYVNFFPPYYGLDLRNPVRPLPIAAQALDMKCPALVQLMRQGKSVALITFEKNQKIQPAIDALMQAYADARAADVKEGLLGQAEATGMNARLIERVMQMLSASGPAGQTLFGIPTIANPIPGVVRPVPQSGAANGAAFPSPTFTRTPTPVPTSTSNAK